jgi:hypothetical protein
MVILYIYSTYWCMNSVFYEHQHGRGREDFRTIIDDPRHHRARSPTPPRRSPVRDVTPSVRAVSVLWLHRSSSCLAREIEGQTHQQV